MRSMVFAVGIPRLQAGEDVKNSEWRRGGVAAERIVRLQTTKEPKMNKMKHYTAVIDVWTRCSVDYDAAKKTEVIELDPNTTIADLMAHVSKWDLLGQGDVRI